MLPQRVAGGKEEMVCDMSWMVGRWKGGGVEKELAQRRSAMKLTLVLFLGWMNEARLEEG